MTRLNSAGRFWLSYLLLLLAGLVYSIHSHAGYYVQVTSTTNPGYVPVGYSTGCYLVPSMAVWSIPAGSYQSYWKVTAMNADGTFSAVVDHWGISQSVQGVFSTCVASPLVASLPNFTGGVSDPAISGDSVLSASGGSSGGSSDMEAYLGFNQELFELAVGGSLLVFALGFGVGLIVNIVRKARNF